MPNKDVSVGIGADNSELLRVLQESKSAMSEFFGSVTEEGHGLGSMLEDIQGKFAAAFNFAGIGVGLEAIKQVGETIERMGQQAAELRTVADVLGVNTDQLQAMREAAEMAGVGQESLVHAGEHLVSILTQARQGSGAAIEKLLQLGIATSDINDPTYTLVNLLQSLHDRLVDSATATGTMNDLIVVLGSRAALAAEAIKKFDGSAEGVAKVMEEINGLSKNQNNELAELGERWIHFGTMVSNSTKKAVLALADMGAWLQSHSSMLAALGGAVGAPAAESRKSGPDVVQIAEQQAEELINVAQSSAREMASLDNEMNLQELENITAGVSAYQSGSAQKLAALQEEYRFAQQLYGGTQVDKVRAIYQQLIGEQRAYFDAQIQKSKEAERAEDERISRTLKGFSEQIDASGRYLTKQVEDQKILDRLVESAQDLSTRVSKEKSQVLQQEQALNTRVANEWFQKWSGVSHAVSSSFSSAISGMLAGTTTFADALRGIFSSVVNSLIQMFVQMGVQWAESLIYQKVMQQTTAASGIAANAGLAATAAMASVAAIPFYGWAMAPEVGATTYGEAMAYEASAFAEQGFDVPSGVNPVTQLHAREMVLPANLADPIREMASGGRQTHTIRAQNIGGGRSIIYHDELAGALKKLGAHFKLG